MTLPKVAWVEGGILPGDHLRLPSGLRQGDGVFETIRTYGGVPFRFTDHLERLLQGARHLDLPALPSLEMLREAGESRLAACRAGSESPEWVLRPCLFSEDGRTGIVVLADPWPSPGPFSGETSVITGLSPYPHPGAYLRPPGASAPVKWLARGPLAHALRAARMCGWDEALLRNGTGDIVEGTRSNLFVVKGGRLIAPGPASGALPGITRGIVVELALARGYDVEDRPPAPSELEGAPEAFLTSTLLGVAPITRFGSVPIGAGAGGGPVTGELRAAFEELVRLETGARSRTVGSRASPDPAPASASTAPSGPEGPLTGRGASARTRSRVSRRRRRD